MPTESTLGGLTLSPKATSKSVISTVIARLAKVTVNCVVVDAVRWFVPCATEAEISQVPELPVAVTTPLEPSTLQPEEDVE